MFKLIFSSLFLFILFINQSFANSDFDKWLKNFKVKAINSGISEKVVNELMSEAKFLPKVIEYDRYQPEFYEDTFTNKK
jgi:membrane-bound lytic murein transglycosylase B